MDSLYELLQNSKVGCYAGPIVCNHIAYADDIILMTSSIGALRKLISICEDYGAAHDINFNSS